MNATKTKSKNTAFQMCPDNFHCLSCFKEGVMCTEEAAAVLRNEAQGLLPTAHLLPY